MIHDSDVETETDAWGLRMGATGWAHKSWLGSFYPDDLPEDWQLGYYANEFSTVLVPAGYWAMDSMEPEDWPEDVAESFVFYLEYPDEHFLEPFKNLCKNLGAQLGGVIADNPVDVPTDVPVYYRTDGHGSGQQIWQPGNSVTSGVGLIQLDDADMRTCRAWLEQFDKVSGGNLQALLVSDRQAEIKKLQELKTLVELMGM